MARLAILFLILLTSCSKGPAADLEYIKQARSLAAEWALVNEQANKGSLTTTYVRAMHQWLSEELRSTRSSLTQPESTYGTEIDRLLAEPADAPPDKLWAHSKKLKKIEGSLEST